MTAKEAAQTLPNVKVQFSNGKIMKGKTKGSLLKYAKVYVKPFSLPWEFSWEAIARYVNTGKPLKV